MAGFSDVTEANILKLYFNATAIANIADNAATSPETTVGLGLHTADPADAGNASTSEAAYTGYARQTVARGAGGFTIGSTSPTQAALTAAVNFPQATAGSETEAYFTAHKASGGSTADIYAAGPISPTIPVSNGVTPELTTATKITLD